MKMPDLPDFHIPESCTSHDQKMSFEEYWNWVEENVRFLREKGLYDKLQSDPLRTPVNARFRIV
ncbi:hypothetical protein JW926_18380 [Candidatus Sumerlaeota bacterium]|nr:hypothetical protein [Candidatus Sumerlaeota bacterium]